jgi:hypothetical protein
MEKREKYRNHPYKVTRTKKFHDLEDSKPVIATQRIEIFPTAKDNWYKLFLDEKFIERVYEDENKTFKTDDLIRDFFPEFVDVATDDFPDNLCVGFDLHDLLVYGFTSSLWIERKGETFSLGMDVDNNYIKEEISDEEFANLLRIMMEHSSRYGFTCEYCEDDSPFAIFYCDVQAGKTIGEVVNEMEESLKKLVDDVPLYDNN